MGNEIDEIIEELFESLLQKYQERLEKNKRKWSFFDSVDYNLHKRSLNRGGSYTDSSEGFKK